MVGLWPRTHGCPFVDTDYLSTLIVLSVCLVHTGIYRSCKFSISRVCKRNTSPSLTVGPSILKDDCSSIRIFEHKRSNISSDCKCLPYFGQSNGRVPR